MTTSTATSSQRVAYHNGILLDASDFQVEQLYHRSRLFTALRHLYGFGTIAGLKIERIAATPTSEEALKVNPGVALDRTGRLLEIASAQCLRLNRWFEFQTAQPAAALKVFRDGDDQRYFVGDVFLQFNECAQGLRPGFPEPAADATDAIVASRTNDSFALQLVPRDCDPETTLPPVPVSRFPAPTADKAAMLAAIYAAYEQTSPAIDQEYPLDFEDKSAVFLARVRIRLEDAPDSLDRHASGEVEIDDLDRPIVTSTDLLSHLLPA
jgi:hypothetical protein